MKTKLLCWLCGLCLVSLGSSWSLDAQELPPCNGKTGVGMELCDGGRGCNGTYPSCVGGTAVLAHAFFTSCDTGSAAERCTDQTVDCTETFFCKNDDEEQTCVLDGNNPLLDGMGKPVVSTATRAIVESCSQT